MDAARKSRLEANGVAVDKALARFMGNEKMLEKYLGRFLEEKSYAALKSAMAGGDREGATAAVHTLKSVCGTIGCETMQQMVVEQEKAMRAGNWDEAAAMMDGIEAEYQRICEALRAS